MVRKEIKNKQTTASMQDQLNSDTLHLRGGAYTAKWSYYYTNGMSIESCQEKVESTFPNACVIDNGDHRHSFVGSAKSGSPKDSYFWVIFKL